MEGPGGKADRGVLPLGARGHHKNSCSGEGAQQYLTVVICWSESVCTIIIQEVKAWKDLGAKLIVGCCRLGPEDITKIAGVVKGLNST